MDSAEKSRFRRNLLHWFDRNQRDLPWRKRKTLYRIWVSEIMLQQTQVVTVIDYFRRFMRRFPNVNTLADATLDDVLQIWEGLGYYRRARQMHAAAQQIRDEHGGRFPTSFEHVVALPGIGRYTAGAILSIATDQPYPVLEGNTKRVYCRVLNLQQDPNSAEATKQLWQFAGQLVSRHRPGDLNQALMELGSQICTARSPACTACPVRSLCEAFQVGQPESLPISTSPKVNYENTYEAAIVIRRAGKLLLRQCQPGQRWADLWDFPRFQAPRRNAQKYLSQQIDESTGLIVQLQRPFEQIRHSVTRFRITLDCYLASSVQGRLKKNISSDWVSMSQIQNRPLSVTGRKIAELIEQL